MIISVVAEKIWYLKKCTVFIGPPCIYTIHRVWEKRGHSILGITLANLVTVL